jgi:hypothetical protein
MPYIKIADGHVPRLVRVAKEYNLSVTHLVNAIIAIGLEELGSLDEPIPYELADEDSHAEGADSLCDDSPENAVAAVMAQSHNSGIHQTGDLESAQIREYEPLHHEHG